MLHLVGQLLIQISDARNRKHKMKKLIVTSRNFVKSPNELVLTDESVDFILYFFFGFLCLFVVVYFAFIDMYRIYTKEWCGFNS